ncbi:MAG: large ribosomal subunit protein bL35 [Minisyncoccia bacterium]
MPKLKTRKSLSKRITLTKNDKVVALKVSQNHFLAKKSGDSRRSKRKTQIIDTSIKKLKRVLNQ